MQRISLFYIVGFLFMVSCTSFKNPEFRKSEGLKSIKIDKREMSFELNALMYNPNRYALKIKPSHVDFFLESQKIGIIYLTNKVKIRALKEENLHFEIKAALEDGALFKVIPYINRDSVSIQLRGQIKGSILGFSKKVKIDETRMVPGKSLKFGLGEN